MILQEIGHSLQRAGRLSQKELARRHRIPEGMLEGIMGVWMRKGRVRKCQTGGCRGGCCSQQAEVIYEWLPEGQIGLVVSP